MKEKRTNHLLWAIPVTAVVAATVGFGVGVGLAYPEQELNGCYAALDYAEDAFVHLDEFAKASAESVDAVRNDDLLAVSEVTGDFKILHSDIDKTRESFYASYDICVGFY